MKTLPFKESARGSIGIELEFQLINPNSFELISRAKELISRINNTEFASRIKPEITQSMVEINTSVHHSAFDMQEELFQLQDYLFKQTSELKIEICGGGTHPFQKWSSEKIYPTERYKRISNEFQFLSKRAAVFGQHIHIGCESGEEAIYLTHALSRYAPHFISICASSPFYEGADTGFYSSRSTIFNSFPLSGVMPFLTNWNEFVAYFYQIKNLGIIDTMKDFYWDLRPKPEFGTVEIRVCDTPLTIKKAVQITAYIQALSLYLLEEKPVKISQDLYHLYNYNRFQASRYAFDGEIIDIATSKRHLIIDDILETMKKIEPYANRLNTMGYLSQLMNSIVNKENDTVKLRQILKHENSFPKVVEEQCKIWLSKT